MSSVSVFVGLDYYKALVQMCVLNKSGEVLVNRACPNDWRRITEVVALWGFDVCGHRGVHRGG